MKLPSKLRPLCLSQITSRRIMRKNHQILSYQNCNWIKNLGPLKRLRIRINWVRKARSVSNLSQIHKRSSKESWRAWSLTSRFMLRLVLLWIFLTIVEEIKKSCKLKEPILWNFQLIDLGRATVAYRASIRKETVYCLQQKRISRLLLMRNSRSPWAQFHLEDWLMMSRLTTKVLVMQTLAKEKGSTSYQLNVSSR